MDRRMKPVYLRQISIEGTPRTPSSPSMSPLRMHHARSGSAGVGNNMKKAQTKAAAQRLAQVMSHQTADDDDDDDEDDDLSYDYQASGIGSIGLAGGRRMQPRSPMTKSAAQVRVPAKTYRPVDEDLQTKPAAQVRVPAKTYRPVDEVLQTKPTAQVRVPGKTYQPVDEDSDNDELIHDYGSRACGLTIGRAGGKSMRSQSPAVVRTGRPGQPSSTQSTTSSRSPLSVNTVEQPSSAQVSLAAPPSQPTNSVEQPVSARSRMVGRPSFNSTDQPLSLRSVRSSTNSVEQPPSARSTSATSLGIKTVPIPSSVTISLRPVSPMASSDHPKDRRLSLDWGSMNLRDSGIQHSTSALQDEIDMLQEENESLLDKLRLAAEKYEEAEARARQLERQVATLGEGVTLEAKLLSRKEAALLQREAALKIAEQTSKPEEALRLEAEVAKDEAASAIEQLRDVQSEAKSLQNMTQRMILTQEEMEEVVLKRCWLARYWTLCVKHGILAEIAGARYEYWSSFAPLPVEVVLSAGERAKDENSSVNDDVEERERVLKEGSELSGDGNIESMLLVEKGLRELASLKVGEAVALAMAQQRRTNFMKSDEIKLAGDGNLEAFELSQEESEDVRFKQAWLTYFWRRAKNHGLEPDIAEERLQFWTNHSSRSSSSHDAVDVERGLMELRKLGIENQLWQASRRGLEVDSNSKANLEHDF
ncbi:PREDICTED: uncharacterized protein LOC105131319 [Populus euphratica]|uniref:Uncharacterized protein LOC105131319 n=1 Tax=Populus euphratica TaxID=75702 RepID=A0AAJ6XVH7_POPEU|nr:PREDICTED: uncharacterized protein LOC105131319 [Populus euphratica]